jgi:hypothetical protein
MQKELLEMDRLELYFKQQSMKITNKSLSKKYTKIKDTKIENYK